MKIKSTLSALALALGSVGASAETVDIEIQNLTYSIYFTPFLVSAHDNSADLFELGEAASPELQAMAEGGDISGLATTVTMAGGMNVENPAGGFLNPGATTMISDWDTGDNDYLSIVSMLIPTNDGFVGLDSWHIPSEAGTYTLFLNAYDAGTEVNDELMNPGAGGASGVAGIPGNPGMNNGTGGTGVAATEENTDVHIHRGTIGDTDAAMGASDLDSRIHRWLNPVVKVVVTVK